MLSSTPYFMQGTPLLADTEAMLQAHALSAHSYHADCRQQYRWSGRARSAMEQIDSLLAHRFATTLVLVGVPAVVIALLV